MVNGRAAARLEGILEAANISLNDYDIYGNDNNDENSEDNTVLIFTSKDSSDEGDQCFVYEESDGTTTTITEIDDDDECSGEEIDEDNKFAS